MYYQNCLLKLLFEVISTLNSKGKCLYKESSVKLGYQFFGGQKYTLYWFVFLVRLMRLNLLLYVYLDFNTFVLPVIATNANHILCFFFFNITLKKYKFLSIEKFESGTMDPVYPLPRFARVINILYIFVHVCSLPVFIYVVCRCLYLYTYS